MPTRFDRRRLPASSHDPLRQLLDFNNPMGAIDDAANDYGTQIRESLVSLFGELTGIDFTDWDSFLSSFQSTTGIDLTSWDTFIASLTGQFQDDTEKAQDFIQSVIAPFTALLNPLFGDEEQKNLLANGEFENAISLSGALGWTWDAATGHTVNGSAKATATGATMALLSNPIGVTPGQVIGLSVWVKWASLTATGSAIRLDVVPYHSGSAGTTITIDDVSSPAANQASWIELSDAWTVPTTTMMVGGVAKPINAFRVRIALHNASAGSVWFDDGVAEKTTLLKQKTQKTIDNITNGIRNIFDFDGWGDDDLAEAVVSQTNTVTGTSAQMIQVLAAMGAGRPDADDFERTSSSNLSSQWNIYQTGTGTLATPNGHDAQFSGTADAEFVARKNNVVAMFDNQIATLALATAPEKAGETILFPTEYGYNDLWLRMTAFTSWATRTGLRFRVSALKLLTIHWFLNGTGTQLYSGAIPTAPAAGAFFDAYAGTPGDPLALAGKLNGVLVTPATLRDSGAVSLYGPLYRSRGFGGQTERGLIVTAHPGRLKQWTAQG